MTLKNVLACSICSLPLTSCRQVGEPLALAAPAKAPRPVRPRKTTTMMARQLRPPWLGGCRRAGELPALVALVTALRRWSLHRPSIGGMVPSALPANPGNGRHPKECDTCGKRIGGRWCESRFFPDRYWCEPCRHASWDKDDPVRKWYVVTCGDAPSGVDVASLGDAGETGNVSRSGSPSLVVQASASFSHDVSPPVVAHQPDNKRRSTKNKRQRKQNRKNNEVCSNADSLCSNCGRRLGVRWMQCKECPYRECDQCRRGHYARHEHREYTMEGAGLE